MLPSSEHSRDWLLSCWNKHTYILSESTGDWLYVEPRLTWTGTAVGAFVGTYSHVLFDSIMHTDVRPMYPFGDGNYLVGIISVGELHVLCLALGVIGVLILLTMSYWRRVVHKP